MSTTPWPIIWTVTPISPPDGYNDTVTVGDLLNFQVKAIPDPSYPGSLEPGTPIPPQPVVSGYEILEPDPDKSIEEEFVTSIDLEDGVIVEDLDVRVFFPYQSIKYMKDGSEKSADTPIEMIDDGFDYVFEFVPSEREFIEKTLTIRAFANTTSGQITGTFWFRINNNWRESKELLEDLAEQSRDYFDTIAAGLDGSTPPEAPEGNSSQEEEFSPSEPEESSTTQTTKQRTGKSFDEIFRGDGSEIESTDTQALIDKIKNETVSVTPPATGSTNPLLSEGSSVDEILRNNTMESLMDKYNLTMSELLGFLGEI